MPPPQPPPPPQHSRINLGELRSQIAKRLGPERSQRYFDSLNKLLSNRLSKPEFSNICLSTLGRENVPLHNQLVRSILQNAFNAKVPPPPLPAKDMGPTELAGAERDERFMPSLGPAVPPPVWSNGDILPPSPRNCRSGVQHRRIKDRPSPLGLNARSEVATHQSSMFSNEVGIRENGELNPYDLKRPVQHHQIRLAEQLLKKPRIERLSPHDRGSVMVVENAEDVQPRNDLSSIKGALNAPLGIPLCPASVGGTRTSVGGTRRYVPLTTTTSSHSSFPSNYDSGELCHTDALRQRMEKITELQGLEGVTTDCANLLNNGLDAYLKQLIKSCVELARARVGNQTIKLPLCKQQPQGKPINGIWQRNHMHVQSSGMPLEGPHEPRYHYPISLQDFKVAMELNPQQLGEVWPLLLEKICHRSFEE